MRTHSISVSKITTKTQPVPEQYELYNLTKDPLEIKNLSDPSNESDETKLIQTTDDKFIRGTMQTKKTSPYKWTCTRTAKL